jgi:hypothetical protein
MTYVGQQRIESSLQRRPAWLWTTTSTNVIVLEMDFVVAPTGSSDGRSKAGSLEATVTALPKKKQ